MVFELRLGMSLGDILDERAFRAEVVRDVAYASGVAEACFAVAAVRAGSVVVEVAVAANAVDREGRGAAEIVEGLEGQARARRGLLMHGLHTAKVLGLRRLAASSEPAVHVSPQVLARRDARAGRAADVSTDVCCVYIASALVAQLSLALSLSREIPCPTRVGTQRRPT